MIRHRTTVTPLYPGLFMPETGDPVVVPFESGLGACVGAIGDDRWYALEVLTLEEKRWIDDDGAEEWRPVDGGREDEHRILVGELHDEARLRSMAANDPDRYRILHSNLRYNDGWTGMVLCRAGNWQPAREQDVVLSPAQVATMTVTLPESAFDPDAAR